MEILVLLVAVNTKSNNRSILYYIGYYAIIHSNQRDIRTIAMAIAIATATAITLSVNMISNSFERNELMRNRLFGFPCFFLLCGLQV